MSKIKLELGEPYYNQNYRKEIEITGLVVDGQTIVIREITPLEITEYWEKFQKLRESSENIITEIKQISGFMSDIFPHISNTSPEKLMPYGFSIMRLCWRAFLAVNEDFLWIADSVGVLKGLEIMKTEALKELEAALRLIIQNFKAEMRKNMDAARDEDPAKSEALPMRLSQATKKAVADEKPNIEVSLSQASTP